MRGSCESTDFLRYLLPHLITRNYNNTQSLRGIDRYIAVAQILIGLQYTYIYHLLLIYDFKNSDLETFQKYHHNETINI